MRLLWTFLTSPGFARLKGLVANPHGNAERFVAKQKFRINNWPIHNRAPINRGPLTFRLDDEAIQARNELATPSSQGRPLRYSVLAITTVLVTWASPDNGTMVAPVFAILISDDIICLMSENWKRFKKNDHENRFHKCSDGLRPDKLW